MTAAVVGDSISIRRFTMILKGTVCSTRHSPKGLLSAAFERGMAFFWEMLERCMVLFCQYWCKADFRPWQHSLRVKPNFSASLACLRAKTMNSAGVFMGRKAKANAKISGRSQPPLVFDLSVREPAGSGPLYRFELLPVGMSFRQ